MTDETQEVVEEVDELLQEALDKANTHVKGGEVRPSALMVFDKVEQAREKLDKIDQREFNNE